MTDDVIEMVSGKEGIEKLKVKKRKLTKVLRDVRTPIIKGDIKNTSYLLYFEEAHLDDVPYSMPFIILPTRPCSWLRKSGGCFECGYSNLSNKDNEDEQILNLFDECLKLLENVPHKMVAVGTSGSFLDAQELSKDTQDDILKKVSSLPDIKIIGIESRPEYVTCDRVMEICEIVYPKKITLGMGLESSNDLIREFCINKGLKTKTFLKALNIITQHNNISALAYVLLGKPFLSKAIDIMDTVNTINFCSNIGFDKIILMATSLRQNTLTKLLYEIGEYTPPSPRMTIEVLKRLESNVRSKVIIANPRLPKPISANRCSVCSELIEQLITMYKYTSNYNYLTLADKVNFNCQCIKDYENVSKESGISNLAQTILDSYERALSKIGSERNE